MLSRSDSYSRHVDMLAVGQIGFRSVLYYGVQGPSWVGTSQKEKMKSRDFFYCCNKLGVSSSFMFYVKIYVILFPCNNNQDWEGFDCKKPKNWKTRFSCFFPINLIPILFMWVLLTYSLQACWASAYIHVFTVSGERWWGMLEGQTTCAASSRSGLALACGFLLDCLSNSDMFKEKS